VTEIETETETETETESEIETETEIEIEIETETEMQTDLLPTCASEIGPLGLVSSHTVQRKDFC